MGRASSEDTFHDQHDDYFRHVCRPQLDRIEKSIEKHADMITEHSKAIGRISQIDKSLQDQTVALNANTDRLNGVAEKVFNGFGSTIDAVSLKLDIEIKRNEDEFHRIHSTLGAMIKFGATSAILIFIALLGVLGSIWVSDRGSAREIQSILAEQTRVRNEVQHIPEGNRHDQTHNPTETE